MTELRWRKFADETPKDNMVIVVSDGERFEIQMSNYGSVDVSFILRGLLTDNRIWTHWYPLTPSLEEPTQ